MARKPFDEVCECEHETYNKVCVCTRKKDQAKKMCTKCAEGNHKLKPKEDIIIGYEEPEVTELKILSVISLQGKSYSIEKIILEGIETGQRFSIFGKTYEVKKKTKHYIKAFEVLKTKVSEFNYIHFSETTLIMKRRK